MPEPELRGIEAWAESADVAELLRVFVDAAASYGQLRDEEPAAQRALARIDAAARAVRDRGPAAHRDFVGLLTHSDQWVIGWAAAYALGLAPAEAEHTLEILAAATERSIRDEAAAALHEWRKPLSPSEPDENWAGPELDEESHSALGRVAQAIRPAVEMEHRNRVFARRAAEGVARAQSKLRVLELSALLEVYADAAAAYGRSDASTKTKIRVMRVLGAAARELRRRGPEAHRALIGLLDHPDLNVRLYAASGVIDSAPAEGERALEALVTGPPSAVQQGAKMSLERWRQNPGQRLWE